MVYDPKKPALRMGLNTDGRQIQTQKMIMSPPSCDTEQDVIDNAVLSATAVEESKLGKQILELIQSYVVSEDHSNPYTDIQIVQLLGKNGYSLTRKDVAKARIDLNILPPGMRY